MIMMFRKPFIYLELILRNTSYLIPFASDEYQVILVLKRNFEEMKDKWKSLHGERRIISTKIAHG